MTIDFHLHVKLSKKSSFSMENFNNIIEEAKENGIKAFTGMEVDIAVNVLTQSGHELFEDLIHMKEDDVILIFGFVYESSEIKVLLELADKLQCKTILISDLLISPMIEKATFSFYTSRGELWEFHSMLAPLALVENIIVSAGKKREKKSLDKLNELYKLRHEYEKILPKVIK